MIRGGITQIGIFEMFANTQMWSWTREILKKNGKGYKVRRFEKTLVQGVLRRIPLGYEYIFPEECLDEVLTVFNIRFNLQRWSVGKVRTAMIRKLMGHGIKPIPEYKDKYVGNFVQMVAIALYPIGIKNDRYEDVQKWGLGQELL